MLTLTTIVSLQAVGNILVVAMLIMPAAVRLFVERFQPLTKLGALIGALCGVIGLYVSYYSNLVSGGTIVQFTMIVFVLCFIFAPKHGALAHLLRRWRFTN